MPSRLRVHVGAGHGGVGGELSHDFLQHVLEGDESFDLAVLVYHQTNAFLLELEVAQLRVQGSSRRYEVGLDRVVDEQLNFQLLVLPEPGEAAQMEDPFHVVDVASVEREAGVEAVRQALDDVLDGILEVYAVYLVAGHHDVVDLYLLEIQDADQHLLVAPRNEGRGFIDHRAQLLRAELLFVDRVDAHRKDAQHTVGEPVDCGNRRIENAEQRHENVGGRKGDALRDARPRGSWASLPRTRG